MKKTRVIGWIITVFTFVLLFGCDDNGTDSNGDGNSALAGNWESTKYEYQNKMNPSEKVDLVQLGFIVKMTLDANGNYTIKTYYNGQLVGTDQGKYKVEENKIIIDPGTSDEDTLTYTLDGNTLTVIDENAEYDFGADDSDEPAIMTIVFQRK